MPMPYLENEAPPHPVAPPIPNSTINDASRMVGKTVKSVEVGDNEPNTNVHRGDLLVIHFTDGTTATISTGSNIVNLGYKHQGLQPNDLHTDIIVLWYRPRQGTP